MKLVAACKKKSGCCCEKCLLLSCERDAPLLAWRRKKDEKEKRQLEAAKVTGDKKNVKKSKKKDKGDASTDQSASKEFDHPEAQHMKNEKREKKKRKRDEQ